MPKVGAPADGSVGADELPGEADTVVVAFGARGKVDVVSRRLLLPGLDHRVDLGAAGAAPVRVVVDRVLGEHAFHERATLLRFAFVPGRDVVTDDRRGVDQRTSSCWVGYEELSCAPGAAMTSGVMAHLAGGSPGLGREPQPRARNAVAQDDELNSGIVLRLLEGFELSADRVWAATSSSARLRPARLHDALGNGRRGAALRRCGMTTTQTLTQTAAAPTLAAPSVVAGEPPWAALPVIIGGALMVILDFFILNVALPSLTTDLHASSAQLEWIVASYALMEAIFLDHSRLA